MIAASTQTEDIRGGLLFMLVFGGSILLMYFAFRFVEKRGK